MIEIAITTMEKLLIREILHFSQISNDLENVALGLLEKIKFCIF
jgi:hypothetical protein